jgi:hypothetical protein
VSDETPAVDRQPPSPPPGWQPDPTGRFQVRYWDGSAWTEHVSTNGVQQVDPLAGVPVAGAAPVRAVRARVVWPMHTKLLVLGGAALLLLGSVLPWAKLEVSFLGQTASDTKNGLDADGVLTLILAVAAFAIFVFVRSGKVTGSLVLVAGVLAGAIALYDIVDVKSAFDDVDVPSSMRADATVGIGLWIAAVASVVLIVGGILCLMQKDELPGAAPAA